MRFTKIPVALLMLCGLSSTVLAAEPDVSREYQACSDKTEGITANILSCIDQETQRQDVRLNKAYKEVMATLSTARKKQLQEAQRAWLKYRDLNCGFYLDPEGGTVVAITSSDCVMTATATRAKELEGFK